MGSKACPPTPPRDPDKFSEAGDKSDWTLISLMIAIAFGCVMVLTAVFIFYNCVLTPEQRLRQAERRRRRRRREAESFSTSRAECLGGSMLDALPVFVYTPENYKEGLRCAVCLCEFLLSEKGRLLPGCNHSFHVDCIDMWFYSHSTCPLCRTKVEKQSNASLELGHREMEHCGVSQEEEEEEKEEDGEEETGENEVVGNNDAPSMECHDNGGFSGLKDDGHIEEGRGHVSVDLGH